MSRRRATRNLGDITLNDFANAAPKRGIRLKKTSTNVIIGREAKQLSNTTEDISWFDKDLEEFDVVTHPVQDSRVAAVDTREVIVGRKPTRNKRKTKLSETAPIDWTCDGNEYPIHVWSLLSEYIRPEDVVVFSCICRAACLAVRSPRFWIILYRRYYNAQVKVPERLTPMCMERPRGLVACVVRTLFFVYPPFVERTLVTPAVDQLKLPSYCVLAWHSHNDKSNFDFHFKFRNCHRSRRRSGDSPSSEHRLPDLLEMLCDIDANEEQGCRVLNVTCPHYVWIPAVMGMFLTALRIGDKSSRRLGMTFSRNAYCRPSRHQDEDDVTIVFESASAVRLLDWWHPLYPYSS